MTEEAHIRYLSTNETVCEKPKKLGYDFVVVDYTGTKACRTCLRLVVAHNAKVDQYELTLATVPSEKKIPPEGKESSFVNGMIFASVCWAIILSWLLWFFM